MVPPAPTPGKVAPTANMSPREMDALGAADRSRVGFDNMAHQVLGPQEAQRLSGLRQKALQRNSNHGWVESA